MRFRQGRTIRRFLRTPRPPSSWSRQEGVCLCALTTGAGVLGVGNSGAGASGTRRSTWPCGGGTLPPARDDSNTSRVAALKRDTFTLRAPPSDRLISWCFGAREAGKTSDRPMDAASVPTIKRRDIVDGKCACVEPGHLESDKNQNER